MVDEVEFYLEDLKSKFKKIDPSKYYLAYSGGRDSHLLYWFLKVWLPKNDFMMWLEYKNLTIFSVNTRMEEPTILRRMINLSDVIYLPLLKPSEIKEKEGIPLLNKTQDEYIMRYQRGSRAPSTMKFIQGELHPKFNDTIFKLNKKVRKLVLNDDLHKIGDCCYWLKKEPAERFKEETGKKEILGIVGFNEGKLREAVYGNETDDEEYGEACFTSSGKFTPLHDLNKELFEKIYSKYDIETPKIYNILPRTGCSGCPKAGKKRIKKEIDLLPPNRRKWVIDYFKESYDVLGIDYETQQTHLELE